nr:mitotic spindle checkpoint protein BUBR1 [Tanacetum cinerariifolium]
LCDSFDENNLFIFDDESVRISPVSKMPFRKKPRDSLNVRSKSNSNKSLPRTVHRWLLKIKPLAEPVAKWISRIIQIYLWIIDSGCSKHMTGIRALLTNFVEKFLGTVRFGNNDFVVIAGYGDVGLEVAFQKSSCFVQNEDGVDFLTGDRSSNLYTIALNEVASNSSTYEASDVIISFIKKTQVNLQLQVQRVRTDNGTEFKNKTLTKFFDEMVKEVCAAAKKAMAEGGSAENFDNAGIVYSFLDYNKIGETHSVFYIAYASHFESKNKIKATNEIYDCRISSFLNMAAGGMTTSQAVGRLSGWYGFGDDRTKQEEGYLDGMALAMTERSRSSRKVSFLLKRDAQCRLWRNRTISFRDLHGGKSIHFSPEKRLYVLSIGLIIFLVVDEWADTGNMLSMKESTTQKNLETTTKEATDGVESALQ